MAKCKSCGESFSSEEANIVICIQCAENLIDDGATKKECESCGEVFYTYEEDDNLCGECSDGILENMYPNDDVNSEDFEY